MNSSLLFHVRTLNVTGCVLLTPAKATKMYTRTHTHTQVVHTEFIISLHVRIQFYICNTFSIYMRKRPCFLHPWSRRNRWKTEYICHTHRTKYIDQGVRTENSIGRGFASWHRDAFVDDHLLFWEPNAFIFRAEVQWSLLYCTDKKRGFDHVWHSWHSLAVVCVAVPDRPIRNSAG